MAEAPFQGESCRRNEETANEGETERDGGIESGLGGYRHRGLAQFMTTLLPCSTLSAVRSLYSSKISTLNPPVLKHLSLRSLCVSFSLVFSLLLKTSLASLSHHYHSPDRWCVWTWYGERAARISIHPEHRSKAQLSTFRYRLSCCL